MRKTILTIFFELIQVALTLGQNISIDTSKDKTKNFEILSKGISLCYRAWIDIKNNELLVGYYFDIVDVKRHRLITYENVLWSNFNRIGFNSTISYSNDFMALSYSTGFLRQKTIESNSCLRANLVIMP